MSEPYDDEVLPNQTADDTDRGWGDDERLATGSGDGDDADLERLRREKPPHW